MLPPGLLKVLIVGAQDCDRIVTVGEQQPYYILECGQQRSKSKVSTADGCNPVWNSAHKFSLSSEEAAVVIIKDEVTKGIIGQAIIDLTRARHTGKDDGATPLVNLGGQPAGSLKYKLKFTPDHSEAAAAAPAPVPAPLVAPPHSASASEAVSRSSSVLDHRPAAAAADADDDPTLASVSNKVSLAKQAMQQLTAELAELTGAESPAALPSPAGLSGPLASGPFGQPRQPQHSSSMREQHARSARQHLAQQQSMGAAPRSYPYVDDGAVPPLSPATSLQSPGSSRRLGQLEPATSFQQRGSPYAGGAAGEAPSADELLAIYGGEQQLAGGSQKDLVLQLQAALAAAHAEKVASEEELTGVKQAMAVMSRQHYMDLKRARDSSSHAGAGPPLSPSSGTPRSPGGGIFAMVDTKAGRGRDSREGGGLPGRNSSADGTAAAASPKHTTLSVATAGGVAAAGLAGAALLAGRGGGDGDSPGGGEGSPVPAYKLRIQVHQLERQLAEQQAKLQQEASKREAQASQVQGLQAQLDSLTAELRQAEANTRASEAKAAEQATQAAAARAEVAAVRAHTESSSSKEAALATEVAEVRLVLQGALADKAELEEALGLLEKNNAATVATLQAELARAEEEAGSLRQGNSEVAALQAQLAAAQEEASGLRNNSEEVEYLQAQLRRTLRQVVELQHQVQVLQSSRREADGGEVQEAAVDSAIQSEHEFLMQELVATKLELAQLKEAQLVTQRQLFKAQQSILSPTASGAI